MNIYNIINLLFFQVIIAILAFKNRVSFLFSVMLILILFTPFVAAVIVSTNYFPDQIKYLNALFNLFRIKYTPASNKKKKCILHLCIMFIINTIDYNKKLVENVAIFNHLEKNIVITFEQIKKSES